MNLVVMLARGAAAVLLSHWALGGSAARREPPPPHGIVNVRLLDGMTGNLTGVLTMDKVIKSDAEWKQQLTPEQFRITRRQATEPAFCGRFVDHEETGLYTCVCCGLPLFASESKFHSGTGWPSFSSPVAAGNVLTRPDHSHGMRRTEILCARCDAHLGHVFADGPEPSGLRYCLNSAALTFVPRGAAAPAGSGTDLQTATFAAGCFWGVEERLRQVKGVVATAVGYTGGTVAHPTYEEVCSDRTGHAEAVQVRFDPLQVTYEQLLDLFWALHDPTTANRQGPDVGSQYRSAIFYHSEEQRLAATQAKARLEQARVHRRPVVTEIVPAAAFWRAEEYHQRYLQRRGGGPACHL